MRKSPLYLADSSQQWQHWWCSEGSALYSCLHIDCFETSCSSRNGRL